MIVDICGARAVPDLATMNIGNLRWMAGTWSCETWGGAFEEAWLDSAGETMQENDLRAKKTSSGSRKARRI